MIDKVTDRGSNAEMFLQPERQSFVVCRAKRIGPYELGQPERIQTIEIKN